jgi:dTDP-4-dehydrorhamnose 3,5-epimerase
VRAAPTKLPGVIVIEPDVHRDVRGFFLETYHADKYRAAGIDGPFVQDNHSRSIGGTLRGLHLQVAEPQAKLIRVIEGEIFDVAVDVRRGSPTFGHWVGIWMSAENFRQCYIPPGFAHGFCVTSAVAQVEYKCSSVYVPSAEVGIAWDDPTIHVAWPIAAPILSDRDRNNPTLDRLLEKLPSWKTHSAQAITEL